MVRIFLTLIGKSWKTHPEIFLKSHRPFYWKTHPMFRNFNLGVMSLTDFWKTHPYLEKFVKYFYQQNSPPWMSFPEIGLAHE